MAFFTYRVRHTRTKKRDTWNGWTEFVTFHIHTDRAADWREAGAVMEPLGLPLAKGDLKWAAPVTIHALAAVKRNRTWRGCELQPEFVKHE